MISRRAQVVALGFFAMGRVNTLSVGPKRHLTTEMQDGLDELVAAGMLTYTKDYNGVREWTGTEKIGRPMRDFDPIDPDKPEEMFRVFTLESMK